MKRLSLLLGFLLLTGSIFTANLFFTISQPEGCNLEGENPKVLLVSTLVDDADMLARAASDGVLVVRYNPRETSLEDLEAMVENSLEGRKAASIAFAAHDHGENKFYLTASESVSLTSTLSSETQRKFWREMGNMITDEGRVDLLACNLAAGDSGNLLMASLEEASSRNFAASTNPTGNPRAGGDWMLETDGIDAAGEYFERAGLDSYSGLLWGSEQKLLASDIAAGDVFGRSVAISGDYAIVGANREGSGGDDSGAAYIFYNNAGAWTQQAKLTALDAEAGDNFGVSVAISEDYAIVGAHREDSGGDNAGAAYIFYNNAGAWTQQAKLTASDKEAGDRFGVSVAISGDYAIVGASGEDSGGDNAGATYIFKNDSGWSQQAKLTASDKEAGDNFGCSVGISGDYAIVGAYTEDSGGDNAGATYIFKNDSGWTQQAKLTASDKEAGDNFGCSVGISGDYAIVGAYTEDSGGDAAGAAYIFKNDSGWSEQTKLVASDAEADDYFGSSVGISGDYTIVGAYTEDSGGDAAGAAYIFKNDSGWSEQTKLVASDAEADDYFGSSVGISGDYTIVGAWTKDSGAGAAYIFANTPIVTTQAVSSISSNTATGNGTITDLGASDVTAHGVCWNTTGAPTIDDSCTDEGAASATGAFTTSMTGLAPATSYYVRAYATNSLGTDYGEGVTFTTLDGPEMNLKLGSTSIADGGSCSLGNYSAGNNTDTVFTISNSGTENLELSGSPIVTLSGSSQFSVQAQPAATTLAASGSTTFTIRFSPVTAGLASTSISIANSDEDENPYNFTLNATGIAGALNHIKIEDAAGGTGNEVDTLSMVVGETLTLYAVGYDTYGNYIGEETVTWSGTGEVTGNLSVTSGTSTTFTAVTKGEGSISADHATATDDTTGIITVYVVLPTAGREAMGASANEPGSQLVFLLDTGINAEELFGDDSSYTSNTVFQYGYSAPEHQNFISITNTHPREAVTVHFRYFNSECVDFFDFLVVLTCNDTMMVDPFDFVVPGTDGVNVKDRFFGYPNAEDGAGQSFDSIPASTFADGRFLLFVTASADVKTGYAPYWDGDEFVADYDNLDLIPYEFISYREEKLSETCSSWEDGGAGASGESLYGLYDVYGGTASFNDDNLHILNASAVSFNYLVGFQTVAKVTELGAQAAYMTQAYARPAVFSGVAGPSATSAPLHALLTGGERIWTEAVESGEQVSGVAGEQFILRHEAHAGDQWDRGEDSLGSDWIISEGGALGWVIFPSTAMPATRQVVNFISFMDNYNGYSNLALGATPSEWDDLSYNIQPVLTIYTIEPFNNSEDLWVPSDPDDKPIVSPVTVESELVTAIGVKCINTYEMDPESNLNDAVLGYKFGEFTLQDLYDMNAVTGTDGLTLEGFLTVLAGSESEKTNEVGPGWMRFSRWFTTRKWTTTELAPDYVYSYWQGWDDSMEGPYELSGPTIFTAGQGNYVFENFGAGEWLHTIIRE